MNTFRIHYASQGTLASVEKTLEAGVDQLDVLMTTVGDLLSAAGFDDDHRLTQMKDYWAELNQTDLTYDEFCKDYPEEQLELPWGSGQDTYAEEELTVEPKTFKRGDVVKVASAEVLDDHMVYGQIGVVSDVNDWIYEQNILVKFAEGEHKSWWCAPIDLDLIWRA